MQSSLPPEASRMIPEPRTRKGEGPVIRQPYLKTPTSSSASLVMEIINPPRKASQTQQRDWTQLWQAAPGLSGPIWFSLQHRLQTMAH